MRLRSTLCRRLIRRALTIVCLGMAGVLVSTDAAGRDNPLVEAVKRADADAVRTLLDGGADASAPEADGTTALHWAARLDSVELADLLIAGGADVAAANAFGVPPLWLAAVNGSAPLLDRLLDAGADADTSTAAGESVLMIAARTGRVEALEALLARGAGVDATQRDGQTALMWAATEGHTAAVRALLEAGADVHARTVSPETPLRSALFGGPAPHSFTALLFAVRAGHIDTVRTLLAAGADPNDQLPDGTGPVVLAATNAHWELGVFLADQGADPNGAEQGWTALHAMTWARRPNFGFNPPGPITTGSLDSLRFARELAARGADVNARMTAEPRNGYRNALNRVGATPLMMAARLADAPLMRVLLELGADPTIANEDGSTLLMVAVGARHPFAGRGSGHRGRGARVRADRPGAGRRRQRHRHESRDRAARRRVPRRQLHRRSPGRPRRRYVRRRERLRLDAAAHRARYLQDSHLQGSSPYRGAAQRPDGPGNVANAAR